MSYLYNFASFLTAGALASYITHHVTDDVASIVDQTVSFVVNPRRPEIQGAINTTFGCVVASVAAAVPLQVWGTNYITQGIALGTIWSLSYKIESKHLSTICECLRGRITPERWQKEATWAKTTLLASIFLGMMGTLRDPFIGLAVPITHCVVSAFRLAQAMHEADI